MQKDKITALKIYFLNFILINGFFLFTQSRSVILRMKFHRNVENIYMFIANFFIFFNDLLFFLLFYLTRSI